MIRRRLAVRFGGDAHEAPFVPRTRLGFCTDDFGTCFSLDRLSSVKL
jgi:hypothetical protein